MDLSAYLKAARMARHAQFFADGLLTVHNADFLKTDRFSQAYEAGVSTGSWGDADVRWRMHILCWAAAVGMQRDGDFVECGVSWGGSAMTVLTYTQIHNMTEGEKKTLKPSRQFEECLDAVKAKFASYGNCVRIVPGSIPDTLAQVDATSIAYLAIDLNNALPEMASLTHFWPRLTSGAVIVLDDYGWEGHHEQKAAFDRFAADNGLTIACLPTGQGIIIKP
jgi:hypothetical protein